MALFISFVCFSQENNWYNGKPIIKIEFKGLTSIEEVELDEIFKPYKGKSFSDEVYWEILQKIYALDYFTDIVPTALPADNEYSSVILEFKVVEKPSVKSVIFKGYYNVGRGTLNSAVKVKKGDIYNETLMKNDVTTLKNLYVSKGYAKAEITAKAIKNEKDNNVTVEFTIKEGKMSVISAINFEGNTKFTAKALRRILVSKSVGFIQKGPFRESALQDDKLAIKMFYGERGYIDAHVETIKKEVDTKSDPQKEKISLTFVIMEGEQFKYSGTKFEGNYIFSSEELAAKIALAPGSTFNLRKFEMGFAALLDLYFENGYTGNFVDKKEVRNDETKEIGFLITIVERERSHIENIIIKGNKKTKDYVILRELLFNEGDVFSKTKYMNSFRNLFNLRYFSSIVPDVQQGSEQDLIDVIVNVEEQSTANAQFGISFAGVSDPDAFPMSVFAKWEEKNLFGTGRELSASLNAGSDQQSLELAFTEPWLFEVPLSVGFNFTVSHSKLTTYQDVLPPIGVPDPMDKMLYHQLSFSFGVHSGYRWTPDFATITLSGGLNLDLIKNFYDADLYRPFDASVRNKQAKWGLENTFKLSLSIDDRDLIHDPSSGWYINQSASFVGLMPKIEDDYYFKSETKVEGYVTLLDYPVSDIWNLKFVLAFYSGFAFQVPTSKTPISQNRQLVIDGRMIGRGWLDLGDLGQGNVIQNNWIEFRWPLAHGILSFDFFFDAVAVKKNLADLKTLSINDYYFSFGPGLRFSIPQFPLRFLFANTFRSKNWKPYWGNGKGADWRFVISINMPNM